MHLFSHRLLNRSPDYDPENLHPPGPQFEDELHEDDSTRVFHLEPEPSQDDIEADSGSDAQHTDTPQGEPQQERSNASDLASTLRATREQDRKKGKAVSRQIVSIYQ